VQSGRICDQPITLVDVYPTLVDLAGIDAFPNRWAPKDVRRPLDGHSLVPLLRGETAKAWGGPPIALTAVASSRPLMVGQRGAMNDQIYSVRSVRYRYILCPNGEEELYDHQKDSHEWYNVAKNPAYAEAKAAMRKELFGLLKFEGAPW
jgi:arylsulfatase A-like enzyme